MESGHIQYILRFIILAGALASSAANAWTDRWDYPRESLRHNEQGTVEFRVDVNEDGKPDKCEITKSSGFPRLDASTCEQILRRIRFDPVLDEQGKRKRTSHLSHINWVLPR